MATIPSSLPPFLRDLLDNPPKAGGGLHSWLFRVARHLHAHMEPGEIADLLADKVQGCGRAVPWREIAGAVNSSRSCAWQPGARAGAVSPFGPNQGRWPRRDEQRRRRILEIGEDLADMAEASLVNLDGLGAEEAIDLLFPENPLLCCGASAREFDVRTREEWRGRLSELAFIVPSPMTSRFGTTQEGKASKHTLSNTGERKYLVCEFDQGSADEHAALLGNLAKFAPLVCAVHSGGKSLHGWFAVGGKEPGIVERFFGYAVSLGADPATWTRSQFVRMPGGTRECGTPQSIFYFRHL